MERWVLLEGGSDGRDDASFDPADIFHGLEELLARLRSRPGEIDGVALAADVDDPATAAAQVRQVDADVAVLWLPAGLDARSLAPSLGRSGTLPSREAEQMASVAALTAGVAHDIGTPLTTILGYGELLANSLDEEKQKRRALTIVEQVKRVTERIDTLVRFSRGSSTAATPVQIPGIVDSAVDFYREKFRRRGIEIQRGDGNDVPSVLGQADRLLQAFMSVLLEIADSMSEGGVLTLGVDSRDGWIEVRLCPSSRDSLGPVDDDSQARLVTRSIVEEHGGALQLSAKPDGEAELLICLPASPVVPRSKPRR